MPVNPRGSLPSPNSKNFDTWRCSLKHEYENDLYILRLQAKKRELMSHLQSCRKELEVCKRAYIQRLEIQVIQLRRASLRTKKETQKIVETYLQPDIVLSTTSVIPGNQLKPKNYYNKVKHEAKDNYSISTSRKLSIKDTDTTSTKNRARIFCENNKSNIIPKERWPCVVQMHSYDWVDISLYPHEETVRKVPGKEKKLTNPRQQSRPSEKIIKTEIKTERIESPKDRGRLHRKAKPTKFYFDQYLSFNSSQDFLE